MPVSDQLEGGRDCGGRKHRQHGRHYGVAKQARRFDHDALAGLAASLLLVCTMWALGEAYLSWVASYFIPGGLILGLLTTLVAIPESRRHLINKLRLPLR